VAGSRALRFSLERIVYKGPQFAHKMQQVDGKVKGGSMLARFFFPFKYGKAF